MAVHHRRHFDRLDQLGENLRGNIEAGRRLSTDQIAEAQAERARIRERVLELLHRFDFLITPSMAISVNGPP